MMDLQPEAWTQVVDCRLEAWTLSDGERQMGLFWTPHERPDIKVLLIAWWCPKAGWQTSGTIEMLEKLHADLVQERLR